jgi:hypothetical protein
MDTILPQSGAWTQYLHKQEHGNSTATIRSMDTVLPQSGSWTQYFHNHEHGHSTSTIRSMDTVLPQSRMEKDKDKHLHDMVQKYFSGEISREQYIRTLEFKYQARMAL